MALITLNPTANTTPDPGQGGLAVTGNINTGHSSTNVSFSRTTSGNTTQNKTCVWQTFAVISGQITAINLRFDWAIAGGSVNASSTIVGDSATALIQFLAEYSINAGGAWTVAVNQGTSVSASNGSSDSNTLATSGSVNVSIAPTTPLSQIRVRDLINGQADVLEDVDGSASATLAINVTVSNIRLEVVTAEQTRVIMMM